jgi:HK97 gp10 family phage protein
VAKKTQLIGEKALARKFAELADIYDDAKFENFLQSEGEILQGAVKATIRGKLGRKTGNLLKGIVAKKYGRKIKGQPKTFVGVNYGVAPHAHLVEYGHGGSHPAPAHPFWRPTVRRYRDKITQRISDKAWVFIKRKAAD